MKVFISWSGDLSKELGEALRDWLPAVIQSVKPFFTPNDIEKGSRWGKDIASELESSSVGIFCLTKDNLSKPWLMFEAGALSKNLEVSKVCPILFGVEPTDLEGPLVQFQASPFDKVEIKKLLKTINSCLSDNKLEDAVIDSVFDMWWPKLQEKVQAILEKNDKKTDGAMIRSERDMLEEVLELSRMNASRSRSKSKSIYPEAIEHLVEIVGNTLDALQEGDRKHDAIDSFSEIEKPLKHFIRHGDLPRTLRANLDEKVDEFNFEFEGSGCADDD